MTIKLSSELIAAIARHSEAAYPNECCGIMLGQDEGETRQIAQLVPQQNQSDAEEQFHRFLITPQMMLLAEQQARALGLDVVGFYHSHPEDEARPSDFDREHAWPWYSYIVVRVRDHKYDKMASWRLDDDRSHFDEEDIIEDLLYAEARDTLPCIPANPNWKRSFKPNGNHYHPHAAASVCWAAARGRHCSQHSRRSTNRAYDAVSRIAPSSVQ